MQEWIGVDFDRTLAYYEGFQGVRYLGPPIPSMLERVKSWLNSGETVKIFTARVAPTNEDPELSRQLITEWCRTHIGVALEVTCIKDRHCKQIWDDIAVGVIPNTGKPIRNSNADSLWNV